MNVILFKNLFIFYTSNIEQRVYKNKIYTENNVILI